MEKKKRGLTGVFSAVMLLFVLFIAGYTVARARIDFLIEDTQRSLETSQGRERKQQYEYEEVTSQLPVVRAELEETRPLAEEAANLVAELKTERKRLRAEKKEIDAALAEAGAKEAEDGDGLTAEKAIEARGEEAGTKENDGEAARDE